MKTKLEFKNKVIGALLLLVIVSALGIFANRLFADQIKGRSTAKVSFNFQGVDEGLNPQGGVFDAQVIKSEPVLKRAYDKLGWKAEEADFNVLANHIIIKGIVPRDVLGRIMPDLSDEQDMQMKKVGGLSYHPTQYQVALSLSREMGLKAKDANLLVDAIIESYSEIFTQRYQDTQVIDEIITEVDPGKYDYSEYVSLVSGQLDIIKSYLDAKEQLSKDFKSDVTGYSFGDLVAEVELIEDVELGNVQALLDSFVITKDVQKSEIVYENMINRMKKDNEKYKHEAQLLKNLASGYKKDKQVVMGSGMLLDETEELEDEDEDEVSLYDSLVEEAIYIDSKANQMGKQVKHYEGLLANLKVQNESGVNVAASYIDEVEESINYISDRMKDTMTSIKATVDDYYEKEVFEGSITPIGKASYMGNIRLNLIKDAMSLAGISLVMMLIALVYLLGRKKVTEE